MNPMFRNQSIPKTDKDLRLNAERSLAIAEIRFSEERVKLQAEILFWKGQSEMKNQAVHALLNQLHRYENTIADMQKQLTAVAEGAVFMERRLKANHGTR